MTVVKVSFLTRE